MDDKKVFWKNAMNYGAILGGIAVVLSLLSDIIQSSFMNWILLIGASYLVYHGTKKYRDKYQNGFISYGKSVLFGTLVVTFAGIILTFLSFVILNYISPELKEEITKTTEEKLIQRGIPEETIEMYVEAQETVSKQPLIVLMSGIFVYGVIGVIISLFTSIFLRKEPNPFQNIGNNSDTTQTNYISEQ